MENQEAKTVEKTWKPTTAGILAIISGVFGCLYGILIAVVGSTLGAMGGIPFLGAVGAPLIILGIVAIVGGAYALKRRAWGLALAGSICALFSPAGLLGILAIIFVAMGKSEFQ